MTQNQIAFVRLMEDRRHNMSTESIQRENIANSYRIADLNARTSMRNVDVQSATSIKVARINQQTAITTANISAQASMYAADLNATTQITINDKNLAWNKSKWDDEYSFKRKELRENIQVKSEKNVVDFIGNLTKVYTSIKGK